jgi:CheY-like chemotaxis protein
MSRPKVLLVEDEGLVAMTMEDMLEDLGCDVVGSFGSVAAALDWLAGEPELDGALLDVNLGGEMVFPVADVLIARGVPIIFATGYGASPDDRYASTPVAAKPVTQARLAKVVDLFWGGAPRGGASQGV